MSERGTRARDPRVCVARGHSARDALEINRSAYSLQIADTSSLLTVEVGQIAPLLSLQGKDISVQLMS